MSAFDSNSQLLQRGLIRASWLLYTEPSLGSRRRSAHNAVAVRSSLDCPTPTRDARYYALCLDLYSPCPLPFLYFPYAGLTYPILLDSRISLVALPQLISCFFFFFFESKHFIYSVRNVHSRETEQHYLNIVM